MAVLSQVDKDQDILTRLSYNHTADEPAIEDFGDWVREVKRLTDFPEYSGSNLFIATTKVAYVGSGAFAVLFLCLLAYELASPCLQDPIDHENGARSSCVHLSVYYCMKLCLVRCHTIQGESSGCWW